MLDLVTKGTQTSSEISGHKGEGDVRNEKIVTSNKRRKVDDLLNTYVMNFCNIMMDDLILYCRTGVEGLRSSVA